MVKPLTAIAILAGIVSMAVVACGGGDEEDAPPPLAAAAAEDTPTGGVTGYTDGSTDYTVNLIGIQGGGMAMLWAGTRYFFDPDELVFKVGETVNFTISPELDSGFKHTFTVKELGIDETVKFSQAATFSYTFDKPGTFKLICNLLWTSGMTGTITVQ